ncbi:MAG: tetratricopeptide repeat protein, partial [Planctomycetaceae bacterium]
AGPTLHDAAEIAYALEDWPAAERLFAALVAQGPESGHHARALSGQGWSLYQRKEYAKAADAFGKLIEAYPDDPQLAPEAAFVRAESLEKAGNEQDAAAAYLAVLERFGPKESAAAGEEQPAAKYAYAYRSGLAAARLFGALGQMEPLDQAYRTVVERFPNAQALDEVYDEWALAHYHRAEQLDAPPEQQAAFARADEVFTQLAETFPESDRADNARLHLAESAYFAGRLDDAQTAFAALADSRTADDRVRERSLYWLMNLAFQKADWEAVRTHAQRLVERFPDSDQRWEAQFRRGEAELRLGEAKQAVSLLKPLLAERNTPAVAEAAWFPEVWILLAEALVQLKQYGDVAATVEAFREWDADAPLMYKADEILGRSYKNQAKFDEAREAFLRVVDHPAGRRTQTAAKSQFLIAETWLLQKDYKRAREEYLKVHLLYMFPEWQAPALLQVAKCDEALGEWEKAVKAYENLLRQFPESEYADDAQDRLPVARQKATG